MYTYRNRCFHVFVRDVHDFFSEVSDHFPPFRSINTIAASPNGFEITISLKSDCSKEMVDNFEMVLDNYFIKSASEEVELG